jgi:hypothetical protein
MAQFTRRTAAKIALRWSGWQFILRSTTVQIAGITRQPGGDWMRQTARNLTDAHDGFLRDMHYVILDRDPLYIAAFRDLLRDSGVKPLLLPAGVRIERVC